MSRSGRIGSLPVGQLSVARRNAIARGWENESHEGRESDRPPSPASTRRVPLDDANPNAVRTFAYQVALATTGPVLRYSQRLQLLSLANGAGIARFDANLIIAAIEHRPRENRAHVEPSEQNGSLHHGPV